MEAFQNLHNASSNNISFGNTKLSTERICQVRLRKPSQSFIPDILPDQGFLERTLRNAPVLENIMLKSELALEIVDWSGTHRICNHLRMNGSLKSRLGKNLVLQKGLLRNILCDLTFQPCSTAALWCTFCGNYLFLSVSARYSISRHSMGA